MRQDFFTYTPAFKLVIAGNHKPGLRGVDEAIRRRFHLLPFIVTIADPDLELPEKLKAEWAGILQWMIEGCLRCQRAGRSRRRSCARQQHPISPSKTASPAGSRNAALP